MSEIDVSLYLVMGIEERHGMSAPDIARRAIEGGVTMIQLRAKNASLTDVLTVGREMREVCRKAGTPFVVNDRVDVALLLDADGVHVGQTDLPCAAVRALAGNRLFVGLSAGTPEEVEAALASEADYVGIGSIYETGSKADAGGAIGTSLIEQTRRRTSIPIVGIGGIKAGLVGPVVQAGADGVAVISAIYGQSDPMSAARTLRWEVDRARGSDE